MKDLLGLLSSPVKPARIYLPNTTTDVDSGEILM
jgi:hypothetical protein